MGNVLAASRSLEGDALAMQQTNISPFAATSIAFQGYEPGEKKRARLTCSFSFRRKGC
jgi:hypothetical protein